MSKHVLFKFLIAIIFTPIFYFVIFPSSVFAETCSLSGAATVTPGSSVNINAGGFSAAAMNHSFHIRFIDLSARPPIDAAGSFIPSSSPPPFTVQAPSLAGVYEIELVDDTNPRTFRCSTSLSGNVFNVQAGGGGGGGGGGGAPPPASRSCTVAPSTLVTGDTVRITGTGFPVTTKIDPFGLAFRFEGTGGGFPLVGISRNITTDSSGNISVPVQVWTEGTAKVVIQNGVGALGTILANCTPTLTIGPGAAPPTGRGTLVPGQNPCTDMAGNPIPCKTALGPIDTNPTDFAGRLIAVAIGLAGGIALIIMVRGAIKILMASGDPQKIADGRDLIVAAVAGLLFLIFSVLILRFLGSDLLGIT